MKCKFFSILVLAGLAFGCAGPDSMIVLVPDDGGEVGALQVTNQKGSIALDKPDEALYIKNDQSLPAEATPVDRQEVEQNFAAALDIQPEPPASFIVYFKFNSNELTAEGQETMGAVLTAVEARGSQDIIVTGHTDRAGEKAYNIELSLNRAQLVKEMIVARGVDPQHIQVTSHGENNPLIPTADDVTEPKNRRVEVIVR